MLDELIRIQGYVSVGGGNNQFLTPVHYWIHDYIRDWHPGLDPEVVSRVEYEDSVAQYPTWYYIYFKWWVVGPVFVKLAKKTKHKWKTSSWR